MNKFKQKELRELEVRVIRINNMLVTPLQNNMTVEKEQMLKTELKYCYLRIEAIYQEEIDSMKGE